MEVILSELYHVSSSLLGIGSIIEPGNWGRIINFCGHTHTCWQREIELERVREEIFPEKPSRFNANFCLVSEREANAYKTLHCNIGVIYKVNLVDSTNLKHIGDLNRIFPRYHLKETFRECSVSYWSSAEEPIIIQELGFGIRELVTQSAIKIITRLN